MGTFETGTGQQGYASEGFTQEGGVTKIKTGKKDEPGRVIYKKGKNASRKSTKKSEQTSSYENVRELVEEPKQQINVEVNKEQVEQINKEIDSKELTRALIEGRVTKTSEGFTVKGETKKEAQSIPPPKPEQLTAPRTISPQETQPITSEVKFDNPFPETNPYPNSMNALKPEPRQEMKRTIPQKIERAIEQGASDFMQYASSPGHEEMMLIAVPFRYGYGFVKEGIGFGKSVRQITEQAIAGENLIVLASDTLINTGEGMVEQAGRIAAAGYSGNIPALSEEAGRVTAQVKIAEATKTVLKPGVKIIGKGIEAWKQGIYEAAWQTLEQSPKGEPWQMPDLENKFSTSNRPGVIIPEKYAGQTNPPELQTQIIPKKLPEETPEPTMTWKTSKPSSQKTLEQIKTASTEEVNAWLKETGQSNFPKIEFNKEITPEQIIKQARQEEAKAMTRQEWMEIREKAQKEFFTEEKTPEQLAIEESNAEIFSKAREIQTDLNGKKIEKPTDNTESSTTSTSYGGGQFSELTLIMKPKKPVLIVPEEVFKPELPPQAKNMIAERNAGLGTIIPTINSRQPTIIKKPSIQQPMTRAFTDIQVRTIPATTTVQAPTITVTQVQEPATTTRSGSRSRTRTRTSQTQIIEQAQSQEQTQMQQQIQTQQQVQMPKAITRTSQKQEKTPEPLMPFPRAKETKEERINAPINIKVRRRGIFQNVGTEESLPKAISKAELIVENTAAASFKLEKQGKTITGFRPGKEFKPSKREPGVMIQKRKFRIGSPGEKSEITQKGIWSKKKSRRKGRWGF